MEMPDWLSRPEPGAAEAVAASRRPFHPSEGDEALAPVDLPSWVQAMRPVEAVISETPQVLTINLPNGRSAGRLARRNPHGADRFRKKTKTNLT